MEAWLFFADRCGRFYTFFVVIISTLLCIFTGMSLAWSSPVLYKLTNTTDNPLGVIITPSEKDWIGSVFSIGGAVGPLILIYTLEKLGRKYTMTILATIFPIFHFVLALSRNIYLYYASRIALGVAVGGSFSIVAVYVSEISSTKMRGTYLSLGTSFILTGCLLSYSIGPFVSIFTFNIIIFAASLLYIPLFICFCPESLHYTMKKYGPEDTLVILRKLRVNGMEEEELREIQENTRSDKQDSFLDVFSSKPSMKAFLICTSLLILQQLCGINVLTTYYSNIFSEAHVDIDPQICTIIVSVFQTATCLITPIAARVVDRKMLLYISFAGVSISNACLGLYFTLDYVQKFHWVPLLSLVSFVIFYNCGLGPLPWAAMAELYPHNVKSAGTAMSNSIYWIVQFILTYSFNKIDPGIAFLSFAAICCLAIIFVKVCVVETRGKTLQEIQRILEK